MSGPKRIQRRRTAGWRMPENAVYVGRPTIWGNPYQAGVRQLGGEVLSPAGAVALYRRWIDIMLRTGVLNLEMLEGRDLACWCKLGSPCHADVLLELAAAYARRYGLPVHGGMKRG